MWAVATLADLARLRPGMVHVTFAGGWEAIRQRGYLLSVASLVMEANLDPREAAGLVTSYRREIVTLKLSDGSQAVLRDQLHRRKNVEEALVDVNEPEWLALLNSRVFFFPAGHARVQELISAYAAKGFVQEEIRLSTVGLLQGHEDRIEVTTVNSGSFSRATAPSRGRSTFARLSEVPARAVGRVQEVTVKYWVPVTDDAVVGVVRHLPSGKSERVFPSGARRQAAPSASRRTHS